MSRKCERFDKQLSKNSPKRFPSYSFLHTPSNKKLRLQSSIWKFFLYCDCSKHSVHVSQEVHVHKIDTRQLDTTPSHMFEPYACHLDKVYVKFKKRKLKDKDPEFVHCVNQIKQNLRSKTELLVTQDMLSNSTRPFRLSNIRWNSKHNTLIGDASFEYAS